MKKENNLYNQILKKIKSYKGTLYSNQIQLAEIAGTDQSQISRFLRGEGTLHFDTACNLLEKLDIKLLFPDEENDTSKDVHFVKPQFVSAEKVEDGPVDENYMAVPKAKRKVAAGQGIIPDSKIDSWILVWKGQEAIKHKSNLTVVEIDNREGTSMEPTLHPGDLVLVDRNDWEPQKPPGNIYLVQTPEGDEMGLTIKRVKRQTKNEREYIIFYPDNPAHEPEMYDMQTDYDNMLTRAVIGRVIWSWSDMTKK